jgi:hypothetical protein
MVKMQIQLDFTRVLRQILEVQLLNLSDQLLLKSKKKSRRKRPRQLQLRPLLLLSQNQLLKLQSRFFDLKLGKFQTMAKKLLYSQPQM